MEEKKRKKEEKKIGKALKRLTVAEIEEETKEALFEDEEILKLCGQSQDGDAFIFVHLHQDRLRFDHAGYRWYIWNEHYWKEDQTGEVIKGIDEVINEYEIVARRLNWKAALEVKEGRIEAAKSLMIDMCFLMDKVKALQNLRWKKDVITLAAQGQEGLALTGEEWDQNPWLLGCVNGVVDLHSGNFREGKQEDYIKTVCPTEWQGIYIPCLQWEKFLQEIFDEDKQLVDFIQRLFGYAITGKVTEHIFPIAWGKGRNGKGTLFETLRYVLGPLAGPIPAAMLLEQGRTKQSNAPTSDIMALRGKRLVWASETDEGRRLDMGGIKWLTGNDTLVGREVYGKHQVDFTPTHKVFLLTNPKPQADPEDYALWNRILLIPFTLCFINDPQTENERVADKGLVERLKSEASGILSWLVRGCLAWQQKGLNPPEVVKVATKTYRDENDVFGDFVEECCYEDKSAQAKVKPLREKYKVWCERNNYKPLGGKRFKERLLARGYIELPRTRDGYFYQGIGLLDEEIKYASLKPSLMRRYGSEN